MTTPRRPQLDPEEQALLSAFLDGELDPREHFDALELLRVRPEAWEWLAAARELAGLGREIWEEAGALPRSDVHARVADAQPRYSLAATLVSDRARMNGRSPFPGRRVPDDGKSDE
jgi:alkylation response protein AidB-like acyl-CoA dehydrogenase